MKATDTRDESYKKVDRETNCHKVLELLSMNGDMTDKQIAQTLGWEINRVTGRRSEMVDRGLVIDKGKVFDDRTNRTVHVWGVNRTQLSFFDN